MIDVFISRPTWIPEEFQEGLTGFISFLDTHDIRPRTLGSTDYPTESPLDEVISIIDECKGVIILGYPQIYVTIGKIKETVKNNFLLPTEWNHIEATLAYLKKLPLLIIHHKGISRGIFEHGAISKFIHEKDLSKSNWFLSEDIRGALKKWKSSISKNTTHTKRLGPQAIKIANNNTINEYKTRPEKPSSEERMEKDVERVLLYLFNLFQDTYRELGHIMSHFYVNEQTAQYFLDILLERELIAIKGQLTNGRNYHQLTPKGRKYIMTNKLKA